MEGSTTREARMIRLTQEPIDHSALTELVRNPHCGGVVTFLPIERPDDFNGLVTKFLS